MGSILVLATLAAASPAVIVPGPIVPPPPPIPIHGPPPPVPAQPAVAIPASPIVAPQKPALHGSNVYVYNYLDLRADHFGAKLLDSFDAQLQAALTALGTKSVIVRYKSTRAYAATLSASEFSASNVDATYGESNLTRVPVVQVIAENWLKEKDFGAQYRLIVFPKNYVSRGVWRFYLITWALYDTRTGQKLWSLAYEGRHMVWAHEAENSDGRARKLITALTDAIDKDGIR